MPSITLEEIDEFGINPPVTIVDDITNFEPSASVGASRYQHVLTTGEPFDALLVNKESDVLVVSLHGALDRAKYLLPRFERMRTVIKHDVSSMYFADPALTRDDNIQLAWHTGWEGFDQQKIIADWSVKAAKAAGATRIIFMGSSGGGFAALQVSALVPGSVCLPFSPQTSIHRYLTGGNPKGIDAQRKYLEVVRPDLAVGNIWTMDYSPDWTLPAGDRMSVLCRYSKPLKNWIYMVQNINEFHYTDHYFPFLAHAARGDNLHRIKVYEFSGGTAHNPPPPPEVLIALAAALKWTRELPPADLD